MAVHPPLLYAAQVVMLTAAIVSCTGATGRAPGDPARRWTLVALALSVAASLLGAWWAHDELGWGGWWAWDPVENAALVPLAAALAALHSPSRAVANRWRCLGAAGVLFSVALTRSGLPESVHAFAGGGPAPLMFAAAAIGALALLVRRWRRDPDGAEVAQLTREDTGVPDGSAAPLPTACALTPERTPTPSPTAGARTHDGTAIPSPNAGAHASGGRAAPLPTAAVWLVGASAAWTLVVVCAAGLASAWLGTREPTAALDGGAVARLVAPAGVLLGAGILAWGLAAVSPLRLRRSTVLVAHAGVLMFLAGAVLSSTSTTTRGRLGVGTTRDLGSHSVTVSSMTVTDLPDGRSVAQIDAAVDGLAVAPEVIRYTELARTRGRPAIAVGGTAELHVPATAVRDGQVVLEIRRDPGVLWVWAGGVLAVVGTLAAAAQRRGQDPRDEVESGTSASPRSGR